MAAIVGSDVLSLSKWELAIITTESSYEEYDYLAIVIDITTWDGNVRVEWVDTAGVYISRS